MAKTDDTRPSVLMIAGFGDDASMFSALQDTALAKAHHLVPFNLPGFGAAPLAEEATLAALADVVADKAKGMGAEIIIAHSVASIIASLAAAKADSPLTTILSLEGNLTAEDAYFSGTAADNADSASFRAAFLSRLDQMATTSPVLPRYRDAVMRADPLAL